MSAGFISFFRGNDDDFDNSRSGAVLEKVAFAT